jgi:hypothetical protein
MNWVGACGGVVPLEGTGKRKCVCEFCFAQITAGTDFASDNYGLAVACAEAITSVGVGRS